MIEKQKNEFFRYRRERLAVKTRKREEWVKTYKKAGYIPIGHSYMFGEKVQIMKLSKKKLKEAKNELGINNR